MGAASCHGRDWNKPSGVGVRDVLSVYNITLADPPPRRPDMNPTENLIALLKKAVWAVLRAGVLKSGRKRSCRSVLRAGVLKGGGKAAPDLGDIRDAMEQVEEAFNTTEKKTLLNLVRSMYGGADGSRCHRRVDMLLNSSALRTAAPTGRDSTASSRARARRSGTDWGGTADETASSRHDGPAASPSCRGMGLGMGSPSRFACMTAHHHMASGVASAAWRGPLLPHRPRSASSGAAVLWRNVMPHPGRSAARGQTVSHGRRHGRV